ncbi:hypothetical protein GWI33_008302 [Rhynchophorus ferrugineus]|uniref:C2H2-type domain-containing protein n=1 Tax=Rhynchophorus ferrugineus TaxID=354439 RepID=A0A834IRI2_RHYFE|nr:hypothetical protein GWI33_008302 [Rhynchophorus ferrugineus]
MDQPNTSKGKCVPDFYDEEWQSVIEPPIFVKLDELANNQYAMYKYVEDRQNPLEIKKECYNFCKLCVGFVQGDDKFCSRKFERKRETSNENKMMEFVHLIKPGEGETDMCMYCLKEIPIVELEKHENIHREEQKLYHKQKRFLENQKVDDTMCRICGVTLPYREIRRHERTHKRMKTAICTICGRTIKNIYNHMASHSNERKYSCDECGSAFKLTNHLQRHRLVHTSIGKHKCTTCEKAFKSPYNLKVHMRSHQDVKPFACQVCERTFTTKQSRDNHLRTQT